MSIWKFPVDPVVEGFTKSPTSTPNWPELVVLGNNPSTLIVVLPDPSVPTVQVRPTVESNRFAQVSKEVEPPELVEEMVTSEGKVMIT